MHLKVQKIWYFDSNNLIIPKSFSVKLVFLCFQCRYTLQYTYPYAYYMESGQRKQLVRSFFVCAVVVFNVETLSALSLFLLHRLLQFEYQQAQLEAEIENLSWKVERADSYERGVVGGEGDLSASDRGVRDQNRG